VQVDRERMWVMRARAGDDQAFAKLVEAYQGPVYNLAYRMRGSPTEAEDAAQETFLRVYTRLDSYDPTRKFSSWILSIASHHCVDVLRRRRGNMVSMEEIMSWRWVPDDRPKPEERAMSHDQSQLLHRLLAELPPQYRLAIVLRYWYDLSYEEMAEISQATVSAIKSRLHRARQMMARLLAEAEPRREATHAQERSVPNHALPGSI
jgi:RNA polymerase sigma-70 factor, ECF subfamily